MGEVLGRRIFHADGSITRYDPDTAEILAEYKPKARKWKWFRGINSLKGLFSNWRMMQAHLRNIGEDCSEVMVGLRNEFVEALSSELPLEEEDSVDWLDEDMSWIDAMGWKKSSIWFIYESRCRLGTITPTKTDLGRMQTILEYKPGWVYWKSKELGIA